MPRLEVTDPARLDEINAEVHDCCYDLDDIGFDAPSREVFGRAAPGSG